MSAPERLSVRGVRKTFGPAKVLKGVDLSVAPGEIHALVGQNGSGKSTLIKILTGLYTPDAGAAYEVDGAPVRLPVRWREVHRAGVSVVHQDLGLLDTLSVAENICVGGFPTRVGQIDRRRRDAIARRTLDRLGIDLPVSRPVAALSAPERAEIAIARAMRDHEPGQGLMILDESTRALAGDDLERVHAMLRRLAEEGSSVLMISHNLAEVVDLSHRVSVMRDGALVMSGAATSGLTERAIAAEMLGGATVDATSQRAAELKEGEPVAQVRDLSGSGVQNVSFDVRPGEILGLTGLPGNGYEQIPYLLGGAKSATGRLSTARGEIDLRRAGLSGLLKAGVALVPERRDRDGLAFELTMRDNLALPLISRKGRPWFVARGWQRESTTEAVRSLDIRPNEPDLAIKNFSGGNQQKVLLAKWLATDPTLLVLHEPTQAVDVGARADILSALRRAASNGVGVLLVTSEPKDLGDACDRVLVYDPEAGDDPLVALDAPTPGDILERVYGTPIHSTPADASQPAI